MTADCICGFSLLYLALEFDGTSRLDSGDDSGRVRGTKTLAVGFSPLLAITLMSSIRGRMRPESRNPLSLRHTSSVPARPPALSTVPQNDVAAQPDFSYCHTSSRTQDRQPVHPTAFRRLDLVHADRLAGNFDWPGFATITGIGPYHSHVFGGRDRVRNDWRIRQCNG